MNGAIRMAIASALLAGCVRSMPAGQTPDGRQVYRIECPPAGGCDGEAREVCGGQYVTLSDGDRIVGAYTNMQTGVTTVGHRRVTLVACGLPKEPEPVAVAVDVEKADAERLAAAEPTTAPLAVRCDYWRAHLRRQETTDHAKLRAWLKRRVNETCVEAAPGTDE